MGGEEELLRESCNWFCGPAGGSTDPQRSRYSCAAVQMWFAAAEGRLAAAFLALRASSLCRLLWLWQGFNLRVGEFYQIVSKMRNDAEGSGIYFHCSTCWGKNGSDEHFMIQRRTKSCPVKPKLSLKPFFLCPLSPAELIFLMLCFLPQPVEFLEEQKSSAVHLAAVLGGNTPSYYSASQAPVDNPFSPPLPRLTLQFHRNPPLAPIPVPGPRGGIRCQCPRKTPLSGTCGGISSSVAQRAQFHCLGFSQ